MTHFDAWASTFGETSTAIELAPEGTGYRARTRFSKFFNLTELMSMFKEVADIKTADQLNLPTPTPHYETVVVQPTEIQKAMVQSLSERAGKVHSLPCSFAVIMAVLILSKAEHIAPDHTVFVETVNTNPCRLPFDQRGDGRFPVAKHHFAVE